MASISCTSKRSRGRAAYLPNRRFKKSMKSEACRLATFVNYPVSVPMIPSSLASAGFFYHSSSNEEDEVTCFACGCNISGWNQFDIPKEKHFEKSPNCRFLAGDFDDVPFGDLLRNTNMGDSPLVSLAQDSETLSESVQGIEYGEFTLQSRLSSIASDSSASSGAPDNVLSSSSNNSRTNSGNLISDSTNIMRSGDAFGGALMPSLVGHPSITSYPRRQDSFIYSMTETERRRELRREKMRLETFSTWPASAPVSKEVIAKAGFYFIGPGDRVRCAFCFNVLRMWEEGDIPEEEHRRYFPNCPLLKNTANCGNVCKEDDYMPLWGQTNATAQSEPSNPSGSSDSHVAVGRPATPVFSHDQARTESYENWPLTAALSPRTLVEAGFFYTGQDDLVRCFHCDMALRLWKADDDAWEEHARWQPLCGFVRQKKGDAFIQSIKEKYATVQSIVSATQMTPNGPSNNMTDPLVDRHMLAEMMRSNLVSQVLGFGYSRETVSKIIERRIRANGGAFPDLHSLLDAIEGTEGQHVSGKVENTETTCVGERSTTEQNETTNANERSDVQGSATRSINNETPPTHNDEPNSNPSLSEEIISLEESGSTDDPEQLLEENRRLKEAQICKICMESEANIVFLPCGHLCCCARCAAALGNCPICRQYIRGTVKTYRS